MKAYKRFFALALALVMMLAICPAAFAEVETKYGCKYYTSDGSGWKSFADSTDIAEVTKGWNGIYVPKTGALEKFEPKYVVSTYGYGIFIYSGIKGEDFLARLDEGAYVLVLARSNGFSLVAIDEKTGGWVGDMFLKDEYYKGPNPADTINVEKDVVRPINTEYLDEYKTQYVKTRFGVRTYMVKDPDKLHTDEDNILCYTYEGSEVKVLAEKDWGMSFIVNENGRMGWVYTRLLVDEYPKT